MPEEKIFSSKTDMAYVAYVVDLPGVVFTMSVQRLLRSVGFVAIRTLEALRFRIRLLARRCLLYASRAVVQLYTVHRTFDPFASDHTQRAQLILDVTLVDYEVSS